MSTKITKLIKKAKRTLSVVFISAVISGSNYIEIPAEIKYGPGYPPDEWEIASSSNIQFLTPIEEVLSTYAKKNEPVSGEPDVTELLLEEAIEEETDVLEENESDTISGVSGVQASPPVVEQVLFFQVTPEEYEIMCRIVEAEVTGVGSSKISSEQMIMSKFRVARVIVNRVLDQRFPNTVSGVIFQKGQFTPVSNGRYYRVAITDLTRIAVNMALDTSVPDDIPGALYFNGGRGHSSRKLQLIMTDSVGHKFYRYK